MMCSIRYYHTADIVRNWQKAFTAAAVMRIVSVTPRTPHPHHIACVRARKYAHIRYFYADEIATLALGQYFFASHSLPP